MYNDASGGISQNNLPLLQTRQPSPMTLSRWAEEVHQQGWDCRLHKRAKKGVWKKIAHILRGPQTFFFLKNSTEKGSFFLQVVAYHHLFKHLEYLFYFCRKKDLSYFLWLWAEICSSATAGWENLTKHPWIGRKLARSASSGAPCTALRVNPKFLIWITAMAMAGELQISFQHPGFTVTFKKEKQLSAAHDSCRKQHNSLSSGLWKLSFFHMQRSFPSSKIGPTSPTENKLELLYKPQTKLLSCLGFRRTGSSLQCYLFSMEEDARRA